MIILTAYNVAICLQFGPKRKSTALGGEGAEPNAHTGPILLPQAMGHGAGQSDE